jgi:UPF0271 protein
LAAPARRRIDLNADLGETPGDSSDALLGAVTSVSVAAGFHAGDPSLLRETIRRAGRRGLSVGAHPSFPDREGFGRRVLRVTPAEAEDFVLYQIAAVGGVAAAEGVALRHVKPHGALYNAAARDAALAAAIARAVAAFSPSLLLYGPPASSLLEAARVAGLQQVAEGFPDRAYQPDGTLTPRDAAGAVITDADRLVSRALRMIRDGLVTAVDGTDVALTVDTLCLHGDTPGAAAMAVRLRGALERAGIECAAPWRA